MTRVREWFAVFVAFFLLGVLWSGIMPMWQGPDEPAHFAYVQYMEYHGLPPTQEMVPAGKAPWIFSPSSSQLMSLNLSQRSRILQRPRRWLSLTKRQRRKAIQTMTRASTTRRSQLVGTQNYVAIYPPLYYQSIALLLRIFQVRNIFQAPYLARLASAAWFGIFGVIWDELLALVLTVRRQRWVVLFTFAGAIPTLGMIGGMIGNDVVGDTLSMGIFALSFWGMRHQTRLILPGTALLFGLVAGLAIWTKEEAYLSLLMAAPVVLYTVWRHAQGRQRGMWLGLAAGVAMAIAAPWFALMLHRYQSIIPPLTYQGLGSNPGTLRFILRHEWGNARFEMNMMVTQLFFGMNGPWWAPWASKPWIRDVVAGITCFLLTAGFLTAGRKSGRWLALTWIALGGVMLWLLQWEYNDLTGSYFLQGRYFLFLLGPASFIAAHLWRYLRKPLEGTLLLASAVLSWATMSHTLWRYYHKTLMAFLMGQVTTLSPPWMLDLCRFATVILATIFFWLLLTTMAWTHDTSDASPQRLESPH